MRQSYAADGRANARNQPSRLRPVLDAPALLRFAVEAAHAGGAIALERFQAAPAAWRKSDGSWVTEADHAVEAAIRARINETFPQHDVLGEEDGLRAADGGAAREGAPVWIVDPIDGTANYVAGIPVFATLVALRAHGEGVLGVVHAPALGETYAAARGHGATMNGAPIACDPGAELADATVVYGSELGFSAEGLGELQHALATRVRRLRGFGDFWGHMLVARGAANAMIEPHWGLKLWDVAALEPIVAEAGGAMVSFDGSPYTPLRPCLTVSAALRPQLLALIAETGSAA
jgi:histidinol-phosphatase